MRDDTQVGISTPIIHEKRKSRTYPLRSNLIAACKSAECTEIATL